MSKFTPGPWHKQQLTKSWGIYDQQGTSVARVADAYGVASERRQADARLIAAAPEMYEALRQIVMLDDDAHPGLATWHEARAKAHEAARAVLAKVEG